MVGQTLDQAEEARLARLIEAGVLAKAVLDSDGPEAKASRAELEQIAVQGDDARQRFLLSHTRFVWSVAIPEARRSGLDAEDLFQEGFLEMSRALQGFDPAKGRFSSYAYRGVRARVQGVAASRNGTSGLSAERALTLRQARAIEARQTAELGHRPSAAQVADELGRGTAWTAELLAHQYPLLMGDTPIWDNTVSVVGPGERDDYSGVIAGLEALSGKQRAVLALRFGFGGEQPLSYQQIAKQMGISLSDARRTCEDVLAALRQADAQDRRAEVGPGSSLATPEQLAALPRIDRLTEKGLSLLEVAIATKTEPHEVVEACQAGGRKDLLTRLVKAETRFTGLSSPGTNVLTQAIRHDDEARQARSAVTAAEAETERLRGIIESHRETPEAQIERLKKEIAELHQENMHLRSAIHSRPSTRSTNRNRRTAPAPSWTAPATPEPVPAPSL